MASQLTITKGKTDAGLQVNALVITGLLQFNVDMSRAVLTTVTAAGSRTWDINATTTLTCTITAGANCTLVINEP